MKALHSSFAVFLDCFHTEGAPFSKNAIQASDCIDNPIALQACGNPISASYLSEMAQRKVF